ncbi:MAG TPA: hypothetical protein PKU74_10050, partial [Candidatus Omnitrophota bacterium]|nr:hypothetical protein [Candidatus Omnitrophota bacterium]
SNQPGCGNARGPGKKAVGRSPKKNQIKMARVGKITHYFNKIMVCVVKVDGTALFLGDNIIIKGRGTELNQKVNSLQVESLDVKAVKKGQLVGLKVDHCVKEGDVIYKTMMR